MRREVLWFRCTEGTMGKLLICVGLALLLHAQLGSSYLLSCYFTNWGQYRPGAGKYFPANVDPCLCDHLIYAFATMKNNELATYEWDDVKLYGEIQALKNQNSNLKTLLAIGGWNFGTAKFHSMVSSSATRQTFTASVIKFLRQYKFDGLDIDWEYPFADKELYTVLLQEMVAAFEVEGKQTNRPRLMLTAAVSAGEGNIEQSYQVPQIGKALDYLHVMTYDYHGSWNQQTGENSPLYKGTADHGFQDEFNIAFTMNYWKTSGAPAEKLLVGFAAYGHTWKLAGSNTAVGAPTAGPGPAGPYTRQSGILSYYEICTFLKQGGTEAWNAPQDVPYAFNTATGVWVGYDNAKSFEIKTDWLKKNGYGGAMVWTIDMDDFSGTFCGQGPYPLINTLRKGLGTNQGCVSTFHPHPSVTKAPAKPQHPATQSPNVPPSGGGGSGFCAGKANGYYPDSSDKNAFYECSAGKTYLQHCAAGLVFDTSCTCCNWA